MKHLLKSARYENQSQSLHQSPSFSHNSDVTTTSHSLRFHNNQNYYNNYNYNTHLSHMTSASLLGELRLHELVQTRHTRKILLSYSSHCIEIQTLDRIFSKHTHKMYYVETVSLQAFRLKRNKLQLHSTIQPNGHHKPVTLNTRSMVTVDFTFFVSDLWEIG
jgi:hypothetical protein